MNKTLASAALNALTAKGFENEKGYCQRWVRQVVQSSPLGHEYDRFFKESAKSTAEAFLNSEFGFSAHSITKGDLQVGDILYKTEGSGGFGHVGILTEKGVAENSSYHARNDTDARGLRTLAQYGAFQVVVRLPDPRTVAKPVASIEQKLVLDNKLLDMKFIDNEVFIHIRDALALGGREVKEYNNQLEEKGRFYINSKPKVLVK